MVFFSKEHNVASLPTVVRIGTRGSLLARWQADHVAERIRALGIEVEIILIQTTGDLEPDLLFGSMPDKGIFIKELEQALLEERIDLAVHSLKDLPTALPEGLVLAAVPERESPLDALVSRSGEPLEALPAGARVGTSSLRRGAQILALRPDLEVIPFRGNVPTRLEKVRRGEAEATLLAVAGLHRLNLERAITQILDAEQMTPPMGQGALGIEARAGELAYLWAVLEDPATRLAAESERLFLARIGGGCRTPVGILVEPAGQEAWRLTAMLASPDGRHVLRRQLTTGPAADPRAVAEGLAAEMQAQAWPEIRAMLERISPPPMEQP